MTNEDATIAKLVELAKSARQMAYAPYSKFRVGAAVLTRSGSWFVGCNVENASYGLCNCAERTALFSAVAAGSQRGDFTHLAVVADAPAPVSPCGACRQVMLELGGPNMVVVLANERGDRLCTTVGELLPRAFELT